MEQASRLEPREQGVAVGPAAAETSTVADLLALFWRRKMLFAGIVVLITGLVALVVYQMSPRYTAFERLMIHPVEEGGSANLVGLPLGLMRDARTGLYGEIEVMTSDRLVEKVANELRIAEDPEFNPKLRPRHMSEFTDSAPVKWIAERINDIRSSATAASNSPTHELAAVLDAFRARLAVRPAGLSNVVSIEFTSDNPDKAARIANTFGRLYVADRMERRMTANYQARDWLNKRLEELRAAMVKSERAMAEFRDASRYASGVYLVLIEAQSAGGGTSRLVKKLAVIK